MIQQPLPGTSRTTRPDVSLAIVNIVLLLILFFLATGAMMNASTGGVEMAKTQDLRIEQLPSPVLVISASAMTLDDSPITTQQLPQALDGFTDLYVVIDANARALDLLDIVARPEMEQLNIQLVTVHERAQP
ncbi:hypothetical protein BFP70_15630 [Thioclava sp. SK-1]|uniref:hypothetical protein n=1 Tax=Thioclava sp. SK-1 TaxID=1889770 RepID=UPI0008249B08|nr:hypothetical protein [Thioclava sp. SK-1]OCX61448.1 hypothetical protein BFP70_15630 [Thioclava sp. SK-1]